MNLTAKPMPSVTAMPGTMPAQGQPGSQPPPLQGMNPSIVAAQNKPQPQAPNLNPLSAVPATAEGISQMTPQMPQNGAAPALPSMSFANPSQALAKFAKSKTKLAYTHSQKSAATMGPPPAPQAAAPGGMAPPTQPQGMTSPAPMGGSGGAPPPQINPQTPSGIAAQGPGGVSSTTPTSPPPGSPPTPPPMPPQDPSAQGPAPAFPAPTPPMMDALPQPLPSNPRPQQAYPKTSQQALQEAQLLSGVEAKNQIPASSTMMQGMGIGMDAKMADFNLQNKIAGEDDVFSSPNTRMRGWQWKALRRDEDANSHNWLPRLFPNESTPLTDTLASPGKQSLLHALGGGALGTGLGYAAGSALGSPGIGAAVGGGLGALTGGAYGYSSRRKKNDEVVDALRKLPPGAVMRDLWDMEAKVGADNRLRTLLYTLGGTGIGGALGALRGIRPPMPNDPDVRANPISGVGDFFSRTSYDPVKGGFGAILPAVAGGSIGYASSKATEEDQKAKKTAAQACTSGPMLTSSVGESKGLTAKTDKYVKDGEEAWNDLKHYSREKSAFADAFWERIKELKLSPGAIKVALDKIEAEFGEETAQELKKSAFWPAVMAAGRWGLSQAPRLGSLIGRGAAQAAPTVARGAATAAPAAASAVTRAAPVVASAATRAAPAAAAAPSLAGRAASYGGAAISHAGGGIMGGLTGGQMSPETSVNIGNVPFNPMGALVGTAMGNRSFTNTSVGRAMQLPAQRAMTGAGAGTFVDQGARLAGYDTGGMGARIGGWGGLASGFAGNAVAGHNRDLAQWSAMPNGMRSTLPPAVGNPGSMAVARGLNRAGQFADDVSMAPINMARGAARGAGNVAQGAWNRLGSTTGQRLGTAATVGGLGAVAGPQIASTIGDTVQAGRNNSAAEAMQAGARSMGLDVTTGPDGRATIDANPLIQRTLEQARPVIQGEVQHHLHAALGNLGLGGLLGGGSGGGMLGENGIGGLVNILRGGMDHVLGMFMSHDQVKGMSLIQKVLLLGGGLMAAGGFASGSPMVGGGGLLSMLGGAAPMLMSMMNSGGPPPGKPMGGAPSAPTPNEGFKPHNELTAQGQPAAPPAPSWMQTAQNFAGVNPVSNWNIPGAESLYNTVMPQQGYSIRPGGPVPR